MVNEWGTRRLSRPYLLFFVSLLSVLAFAATAGGTLLTGALDAFDGNLAADGARDWANIGIVCETAGCAIDEPTGTNDDSFGQGTAENDDPPTRVTGSIPNNKSDLTRFYVANEKISGKDLLYLAWERVQEPNGTTNMDFEFNQGSTLSSNGVTYNRTQGDLLIKYDLSQGGTNPTLGYHRWETAAANPTATSTQQISAICEAGNKFPCWRESQSLAGNFEGAINTGPITDPINPDAPRPLSPRTFGEAAINLTDSGLFPAGSCTSFGSGYLKSRSSDSFTAEIKDFIAPIPVNVSNCGTIVITKVAEPADGTDFTYSDNIPTPCAIGTLDVDSDSTYPNTITCSNVQAGSYSVTEIVPANWSLTGLTCTDPSSNSSGSTQTGIATINLAADETVSCTFTNKKRATVTVIKDATPEDGTDFAFGQTGLGTPTSFTLDDDANDSGDGTGGDYADRRAFTLAGSAFASGNVSASVSETIPANWSLTGRSCTGVTASNSGSNGLTFTVQPGDSITCTFVNVKDATVTITKDAVPNALTDFSFSVTGGGWSNFSLDDDAGVTNADNTLLNSQTFTFSGANFGAKTISETAPLGWTLTGLVCSEGTYSAATGLATLTVDPGDAITCTYTNTSKHVVITIVCHQGTGTLFQASVTDVTGAVTKQTLSSAPSGLSDTQLCGLGGARFEDLNHVTNKAYNVTIPLSGH